MPGLFSGTPQQAPTYTTSTSETPRWMQDAIYNQIQWSQNIANTPFQAYTLPRVADLSAAQNQAYFQSVPSNQNAWLAAFNAASTGTQGLTGASASAPLVATLCDVTGILIYFLTATFWLAHVFEQATTP